MNLFCRNIEIKFKILVYIIMNRKIITALAATILCHTAIQAQVADTEFWFVAPEISDIQTTYDGLPADRPIKLHFAARNQGATVQISQPALNSAMPTQTVTVPANDMASIDLTQWIDAIETAPSNNVLKTGLRITSSAPITAYYTNEDVPNAESFMLKGKHALGTDFWIPSQNIGANDYGVGQSYSSFDIIATMDNTVIGITPSKDIVGHNANVPFSITLNKGETWSAEASDPSADQHLGGSHITSKNPIAITVKDDLLDCPDIGGAYELIGDQILPANYLGTKYATVKGDLTGQSDRIFVIATEDNTIVKQNGTQVGTIDKGQTAALSFNTENVAFVETTKPASVYHLSGVGAETGAKQLIPITEKGSDTVYYQRLMNDQFKLTFVVKNAGVNSFIVNGSSSVVTSNLFLPVPGNTDYSYAKIDLSTGNYLPGTILKVANTTTGFQMGVLDGAIGWGCDYAYFNEFSPEEVETGIGEINKMNNISLYPNPANKTVIVQGVNIENIKVFNVLGQEQKVNIDYSPNVNIITIEALPTGNYILEAFNRNGEKKSFKFIKARE